MNELALTNLPPDINQMEPAGLDLLSEYWSPEKIGEYKNLVFVTFSMRDHQDIETGEVKNLECAIFVENVEGSWRTIENGSSRLVNGLKNARIQPRDAVRVQFNGRQKNKTNSYSSDSWSIYKLRAAK